MNDNQGTTQELLDGRAATYGDRVKNMDSVSDMVNAYIDGVEQRSGKREITGADFAMIMLMYKTYRFAVAPDYKDNIADIFGYAQIAEECVGLQMISAPSAQEYQAVKQRQKENVEAKAREEKNKELTLAAERGVRAYLEQVRSNEVVRGGLITFLDDIANKEAVRAKYSPGENDKEERLRDAELNGKRMAAELRDKPIGKITGDPVLGQGE